MWMTKFNKGQYQILQQNSRYDILTQVEDFFQVRAS